MRLLRNILQSSELRAIDLDGQERLAIHADILAHKQMLREVFREFHHLFNALDQKFLTAQGLRIELGAGIAPIRDSYPDVLATDFVFSEHLDRVLDAQAMDLADESVRTIFGQNCFHHFPQPERFLHELDRVLAPGGGAILLEPYYGLLATFLFKRLFRTEIFDKDAPSWQHPVNGPMNGANQALSYIVFKRDRARFERENLALKIVCQMRVKNGLKYLLSGGLNFRQLVPDTAIPLVELVQRALSPLGRWTSLHHVVVIRKERI